MLCREFSSPGRSLVGKISVFQWNFQKFSPLDPKLYWSPSSVGILPLASFCPHLACKPLAAHQGAPHDTGWLTDAQALLPEPLHTIDHRGFSAALQSRGMERVVLKLRPSFPDMFLYRYQFLLCLHYVPGTVLSSSHTLSDYILTKSLR